VSAESLNATWYGFSLEPRSTAMMSPGETASIRPTAEDNGADLYKDEAMRLLHVVLVSSTVVIGLAAPAQADPGADANFLAALNNAGITYQSGPDAAGIGQRACQLMDQGHAEADVIKGMTEQNAGFTTDAATKFVQIAENVYCPQHIGGAGVPPPPPQEPAVPPFFPLPPPPAAL
jgi:hypothetical protein